MNAIVRTPTRVAGGLTTAEQEALKSHTAKWIANAMSTDPVSPERLVPAIKALYKDLIAMRKNVQGNTRGLSGWSTNMHHVNNTNKVVGFHRWQNGGPGDDVVVVANFSNSSYTNYRIGLPRAGLWRLRFNSDWNGYSADYSNYPSFDTTAAAVPWNGMAYSGVISMAPYTALIYSQTPQSPADLNGDWTVDGTDLGILLGSWGASGAADLNQDGTVDGTDLGILLGAWGIVQ